MSGNASGFFLCAIGYLLGSIPFGLVFSKIFRVVDPRTGGSGNIGFTNVLRTSGKKIGILTLLGDFGKGWLISWVAISMFGLGRWALLAAFCVVLGHIFSMYLGFHGGKGVATGLGAILGLQPILGSMLLGLWLAAFGIWRYSSGGAITAFLALPILSILLGNALEFTLMYLGMSALIIFKHTENIKRIINGTEKRPILH